MTILTHVDRAQASFLSSLVTVLSASLHDLNYLIKIKLMFFSTFCAFRMFHLIWGERWQSVLLFGFVVLLDFVKSLTKLYSDPMAFKRDVYFRLKYFIHQARLKLISYISLGNMHRKSRRIAA